MQFVFANPNEKVAKDLWY